MKLPKLELSRKGSAKAAKPAGKGSGGLQPPAVVQNVYRDLRDRHLLLPAIALLAALVAVPVLLKSDPAPPPAAPPAALAGDATAVEPAVLAEQLGGVRNYRERLAALKQKNPFKQQYLIPTPKGETVESVGSSQESETITSGGGAVTGGSEPVIGSGDAGSTVGGPPASRGPSGPPQTKVVKEPKPYLYSPRVDVVIAHGGERKKYESVKPGQLLPDRKTPIAMFFSAPNSLKSARFVLSSDVGATSGDGHCAPSADKCEFLKLGLRDKRVLEYGEDAEKYSIMLTKVRRARIDDGKRK